MKNLNLFCYFNLNLTNSNEFGFAVISKGRYTSNKYIISNLCPKGGLIFSLHFENICLFYKIDDRFSVILLRGEQEKMYDSFPYVCYLFNVILEAVNGGISHRLKKIRTGLG